MGSRTWKLATLTVASGAALALAAPAYASTSAVPPQLHVDSTLSSAFVGPLQFAVDGSKTYVADSFTSSLNLIGQSAPLATGPDPSKGGDLAGVAVDPATGAVAYTTNNFDHSETRLWIRQGGQSSVLAKLSGFEKVHNPDGVNQYGTDSTDPCVVKALQSIGAPVKYTGGIDSHAYAVTALGKGAWAVADAGGNDVLRVDRFGNISVLSVLPPDPVKITKAFADSQGLPSCVVGITYKFEPVPTDVEVGPQGRLYVSSLPGGPEGPDSGNSGSVYRLNTGAAPTKIATGFAGATNLAIDSQGGVYVAEIGSSTVSKVVNGAPVKVLSLTGVVGIEYANGHLYASTAPAAVGAGGPGSIVRLSPGV